MEFWFVSPKLLVLPCFLLSMKILLDCDIHVVANFGRWPTFLGSWLREIGSHWKRLEEIVVDNVKFQLRLTLCCRVLRSDS